jgi:hypothetical protein
MIWPARMGDMEGGEKNELPNYWEGNSHWVDAFFVGDNRE